MTSQTYNCASQLLSDSQPHTAIDTLLQRVSVLLVDDDPHFRQGLRTLLDFYSASQPLQFNVVGEAASGQQAISLAAQQQPALILLDMELSQGSDEGIKTLRLLREVPYKGKVLVLSVCKTEEVIFRSMQAGAFGYLFKDNLPSQLHAAITTVIGNQVYLCPEVATRFFRMFHFYAGRSLQDYNPIHLTNREQEVLKLLLEGASNEEIAHKLYITVATVKAHLTAIFEKLGVTSRTLAVVKALKLGLV